MKKIEDQFSGLNVSRQRKYQLRHAASGVCMLCTKPSVKSHLCESHYAEQLDRVKRRQAALRLAAKQALTTETPAEVTVEVGSPSLATCAAVADSNLSYQTISSIDRTISSEA